MVNIKAHIKQHLTISGLKADDGLSLIEAAIGLIIVGVISVPLLQSYKIDLMEESYREMKGTLAQAREGINQYYIKNSEYPCPASLIAGEGDPLFGVEFGAPSTGTTCDLANIPDCVAGALPANAGVCKTNNTVDATIIGGVPFATLQIQQEAGLDYWNNKLLYAVTFAQTQEATFDSDAGRIQVLSVDNPTSNTADGIPDLLPEAYDFVLISTGPSEVGAYSYRGQKLTDCATAAEGYDHENCDFDDVFFFDEDPNVTLANARSESLAADPNGDAVFFDDYTLGQKSVPEGRWFQHEENPNYTKDYALTLATRVGVGFNNPTETLDVNGNIRIQNQGGGTNTGRLKTNEVCEELNPNPDPLNPLPDDASNCMQPPLISGSEEDMNCDRIHTIFGSQPVHKIKGNRVLCVGAAFDNDPDPTDTDMQPTADTVLVTPSGMFNAIDCSAATEVAIGIDANGDIICAPYGN